MGFIKTVKTTNASSLSYSHMLCDNTDNMPIVILIIHDV